MTHLRRKMLEELERRNYSEATMRRYLRFVERFAQHFGKSPDKLGPDHIRSYQAYLLKARKLDPGTVENHVAALRFLFIHTLHRHEFRQFLPYPKVSRKLPKILSREEVGRLIDGSRGLFERTLLMVLYGTGIRDLLPLWVRRSKIHQSWVQTGVLVKWRRRFHLVSNRCVCI